MTTLSSVVSESCGNLSSVPWLTTVLLTWAERIQFTCSWTISRIFSKMLQLCLCHWILMLLLSLLHLEPSPWRKARWSITGRWARAKGAVSTGGVRQSSVVSSKKWERSWAPLNLPSLLAGPGKVRKNKELQQSWGVSGAEENGGYQASIRLASCSAMKVNFLPGVPSLSSAECLTRSQDLWTQTDY